ncbi:hypothetical protein [Nonomuraea typhae]|uniref:RHS repeat-associated core domain-containing protein n=1 Tax=Nonomuraea typhae TaxID=2603600 RepID=A0ABW7Z6H1_9ACTN
MKSTYYYNTEARVSQFTPPGLAPWRYLGVDASGRTERRGLVTRIDTGARHIQRSDGSVTLQLADLHGDITATMSPTDLGINSYSEYTEYGAIRASANATARYGWLGSHQRERL